MDLKKAVVSAIIMYAIIFLIASALVFNIQDEAIFGSIMVILVIILSYLLSSKFYFKGLTVSNPIKDGLAFGLVVAVISFIIEIPVMVYGFAAQQGWGYFADTYIIAGYIMMLIIPVIVAYRKKK